MKQADSTFLTRVVLKNYKSIAACDVRLGPLMFLAGPNGSGKSNFLDALRFVADALNTSLEHALGSRGGMDKVRRRAGGPATHFDLRLEFVLSGGVDGHYAFRVDARPHGGFEVQREECRIRIPAVDGSTRDVAYTVHSGEVREAPRLLRGLDTTTGARIDPTVARDRLYLVHMSAEREFRPLYDALSRMGFYNLNPVAIHEPQPLDPGERLARDGSNLAAVVARMSREDPERKRRVEAYLAKVVPGVQGVEARVSDLWATLEFRQGGQGARNSWRLPAANMSDGTLRALGVLVAVLQPDSARGGSIPLIGIEEPEAGLHPAASGVLLDSLLEASDRRQVLITSHSPDLLDNKDIAPESLLAVALQGGATRIGPLEAAAKSILQDRLYTPGELLRQDQMKPDLVPTTDGLNSATLVGGVSG